MKHFIVLILASPLWYSPLAAMENRPNNQQLSAIVVSPPRYDAVWNEYTITATLNQSQIGSIYYRKYDYYTSQTWTIKRWAVIEAYRKKGIGSKLLQACVTDIKNKEGKEITWFALPFEPNKLSECRLISIFRKVLPRIDRAIKIDERETGPDSCRAIRMTAKLP